MKYSEETLQRWARPLSDTEQQKVEHAESMIKDALYTLKEKEELDYEVFAQGSYANNTNVRQNSDVDICVMLTSTFYTEYPEGCTASSYGFYQGGTDYKSFKSRVVKALQDKFGAENITIGNKSIKISENSYHVEADVVPAFQYRNYAISKSYDADSYEEGIKYESTDGEVVINYPKRHIENGISKNNETNYFYKKLVRIIKHIRDDMVDERKADGKKITSFLIECLVWNVSNDIIMKYNTWEETVQHAIAYLLSALEVKGCEEWMEVNGILRLFRDGRKWSPDGVKRFLCDMYAFLEF